MKIFLLFLLCPLLAIIAIADPAKPTPLSGSYMRFVEKGTDDFSLELAVRTFTPKGKNFPKVTLISAIHIGSEKYYNKLQQILDEQKLVLYEGVGGHRQTFKKKIVTEKSPDLSKKEKNNESSEHKIFSQNQERDEENLYAFIASASGLRTQLACIQYDRKHFQNADLSMQQMRGILRAESKLGGTKAKEAKEALILLNEFERILSAEGGLSMFLTRGMLHVMKSSPALRTLFLFNLATTDDERSPPTVLPGMTRLWQLILHDRNKTAISFLKTELDSGDIVSPIGIFYGAAHMRGMEEILVGKMNYQLLETKWLTAFQLQPKRSGLSDVQIKIFSKYAKRHQDGKEKTLATDKE